MDSKLTHLEQSQQDDIQEPVQEYSDLFPDVPTRTTMISHDVDVSRLPPPPPIQ
jgi:hypothetical protein